MDLLSSHQNDALCFVEFFEARPFLFVVVVVFCFVLFFSVGCTVYKPQKGKDSTKLAG